MTTPYGDQLARWRVRNPIRVARRRHGVSRQVLAHQVGASYEGLRNLEVGRVTRQSRYLAPIAAALEDPGLPDRWETWLRARPRLEEVPRA